MLKDYYFNRLCAPEQQIYKSLHYGYKMGLDTLTIPMAPNDKTIFALQMEHPELFYCNPRNYCFEMTENTVILHIEYSIDKKKANNIEHLVKNICKLLDGSDDEVVRIAHNYYVKNVKYDYECTITDVEDQMSHTAAGPFLYGRGVCDGISLAFKMLLDRKGIDNAVVVGTLKERGCTTSEPNHMWNVVSINGKHYFIDVTQDIGSTDPAWNKPSYLYYMLTDDELRKTHIWKGDFHCNSIKDNPFDKYNKHFRTVGQIKSYVSNLPKQEKLIYFKCTNLPETVISRAVMTALASPSNTRVSLSMVSNAGRYYFYKEN